MSKPTIGVYVVRIDGDDDWSACLSRGPVEDGDVEHQEDGFVSAGDALDWAMKWLTDRGYVAPPDPVDFTALPAALPQEQTEKA